MYQHTDPTLSFARSLVGDQTARPLTAKAIRSTLNLEVTPLISFCVATPETTLSGEYQQHPRLEERRRG